VALLVVLGAVPLPDLNGALEDAAGTLGGWAYPAVAGFAFLETGAFVGLAVPGETAVVVGGVVAARGEVELAPLIALVWFAAAGGDLVSFIAGRRLGRPFLSRHGPRLGLGPERLERVERFYDRHGGKAVLVGRFAGLVRAVSPFLAGASGLTLRRFVGWSATGALLWATTFTLVGYGFSESFAESGDTAARLALGAAALVTLVYAAVSLVRSGRLSRQRQPGQAQGRERAERAQGGADERSSRDVEREVNAQVDARQAHRGGDQQRHHTQAGADDGHRGGRGERRGAVSGGKGRVGGKRDERVQAGLELRRPGAVEGILQSGHHERGSAAGRGGSQAGDRQPPPPPVGAQPEPDQDRALDPPGREPHEQRGQQGVLEGRSGLDEPPVEVEQRRHHPDTAHAGAAGPISPRIRPVI
jgi:membrane protein DedA with SNARE-associated domain